MSDVGRAEVACTEAVAVDTSSSSDPGPGGSPPRPPEADRRFTRFRRMRPEVLLLTAVLVAFAVFVSVRLGPSLLGFRVFAGLNALVAQSPWANGGPISRPLNPYVGDTLDSVLPSFIQLHARIWSGDIAWWSSLSGPGSPLFSEPNASALNPVTIWMVALPPSWAIGFAKLLQLLVAGAGMMLWLRRLGTKWWAGALAGLVYCGSGFFVAWADWTSQSSVAAFIPALFWAVERFLQMRTVRSALPISAAVACLLFAGFPAAAGHAMYAAAAYLVVRLIADRRAWPPRQSWWALATAAGAVVLGVALTAIQLLPFAHSLVGTDLSYRDSQFNAQQPSRSFLSVFFPRIFNVPGYFVSNPIEAYAFLGMGVVVLALLAAASPRHTGVRRGAVTFLALTGLLAAALVWKQGFWTDWLRDVPIFSGNNSGRLRDMVGFAGCALAGIGANMVFRRDLHLAVRKRLLAIGTVSLLALAGLTAAVWYRYRAVIDTGLLRNDALLGLGTVAVIVAALAAIKYRRTVTFLAVCMVAFSAIQVGNSVSYFWPDSSTADFYPDNALINAAVGDTGSDRALALSALPGSSAAAFGLRTVTGHTFQPDSWKQILLALDPKAYSGPSYSPTNPGLSIPLTDPRLRSPLLDRMAVSTIVASPGRVTPGPAFTVSGQKTEHGAPPGTDHVAVGPGTPVSLPLHSMPVRGIELYLAAPVSAPSGITLTATITDTATDTAAVSGSLTRTAYPVGWVQFPIAGEGLADHSGALTLSISATTGSGVPIGVELAGHGTEPTVHIVGTADDGMTLVYASSNGTVWHRSTALPRIRWASGAVVIPDPDQRLRTLADPAFPATSVVLSSPAAQPSGAAATLTTIVDHGDQVDVDVNAAGAGYLVLADGIQSNWVATVDGAGTPIVDADNAFGAVFVPAGTHRVEFSVAPAGLRNGIIISSLALVLIIALLVVGEVRRRWIRKRVASG